MSELKRITLQNGRCCPQPKGIRGARGELRWARNSILAGVLLASVYSLTGACSVLVKEQEQCQRDSDCEALGSDFAGSVCEDNVCVEGDTGSGDYSCLGQEPPAIGSGDVEVAGRFATIGGSSAPPGLMVSVCDSLDLNCVMPNSTSEPDESGEVTLEFKVGFKGYVQATSDATLPTQLLFPEPVTDETVIGSDGLGPVPAVPLFTEAQLTGLLSSVGGGVELDPDKAHLFMSILDCADVAASGLYLDLGDKHPDATIIYVEGGAPDRALTETGASGQLTAVNLTVGLQNIVLRRRTDDENVFQMAAPLAAGRLAFTTATPNQ